MFIYDLSSYGSLICVVYSLVHYVLRSVDLSTGVDPKRKDFVEEEGESSVTAHNTRNRQITNTILEYLQGYFMRDRNCKKKIE